MVVDKKELLAMESIDTKGFGLDHLEQIATSGDKRSDDVFEDEEEESTTTTLSSSLRSSSTSSAAANVRKQQLAPRSSLPLEGAAAAAAEGSLGGQQQSGRVAVGSCNASWRARDAGGRSSQLLQLSSSRPSQLLSFEERKQKLLFEQTTAETAL